MSNQEDRVLNRRGARLLSPDEVRVICGANGASTETVCSFNPVLKAVDGDIHEC